LTLIHRYQAYALPAVPYQKAFGDDVSMPEQSPGHAC